MRAARTGRADAALEDRQPDGRDFDELEDDHEYSTTIDAVLAAGRFASVKTLASETRLNVPSRAVVMTIVSDLRAGHPTMDVDTRVTETREVAFARFVETRLAEHYRIAAVILGDPVDAQDAVHDAFERAWRGQPTLRHLDKVDAWVARIVVNECRDRLRRRRRRPVTDISEHLADTLAAPDQLRAAADRDEIGRAFGVLNPDQQIAVALRFYADLTVDQIADRVSAPAGTVKSRLHHALAIMNAELSRARPGGIG